MPKKKDSMEGTKALSISVKAKLQPPKTANGNYNEKSNIPTVECTFEQPLYLIPGFQWRGFDVIFDPSKWPEGAVRFGKTRPPEFRGFKKMQVSHIFSSPYDSSMLLEGIDPNKALDEIKDLSAHWFPVTIAITSYELDDNECKKLKGLFFPEVRPATNEYFGKLLKRILEGAGYVITIEVPDYYYPAPTSVGYLAPAFGLSLTKNIEPTFEDGYKKTYSFFSYDKPMIKTKIQRNFLDEIPEERLERIARHLKENLNPYGLKCLNLVMRECGRNNRNPWFVMDTNKCLDAMGYERNTKGVHLPRNKQRLYRELEALAKIRFNVEARAKKKGAQKTEIVLKFDGALLHITHLEVHEVKEGKSLTENTKIQDGVRVFIDPDIYSYVEKGWYAVFPDAFLKIDTGRRGHAIQIYHYINNQWRIGWFQHHGIFKQGLLAILDNSGALGNFYKKRRNQQRDYINQRLNDLTWLKEQKEFWIKDVKEDNQNRSQFDPMITVIMANDHPLRSGMRRQIGEKVD